MKALSLWQPWALLCLLGGRHRKRYETRHWWTSYRGPLLIHAAKRVNPEIKEMAGSALVVSILREHFHADYAGWKDLPLGSILGRVRLVDCRRMRDLPPPSHLENALGHWSPERYAWKFDLPELFAQPVPYVGKQGLFTVNSESMAAVAAAGSKSL